MSGDKYLISDKAGCYFVTFTVIHWIDIFSRKEYRDIIVDSLNYCISPLQGVSRMKRYVG